MAKRGGSRINSGPMKDPNAYRRDRKDDQSSWLELPADGCSVKVPAWPYPKGSVREKKLWAELWRTPQAFAWHQLAIDVFDVAEFVKLRLEFESGRFGNAAEIRQRRDGLGLSAGGMVRNSWRVTVIEDTSPPRVMASAKEILSVVK